MKDSIKFQLKSIFSSRGFISVCIFGILFAVVSFIANCVMVYGFDKISVQSAYALFYLNGHTNSWFSVIYSMIFPFLVCCAASDCYVSDYERNYIPACVTRTGLKKYYYSKLIAVFTSGAFVMVIPQLINYALCIITFPGESTNIYTWDLWQASFYTYEIKSYFVFRNLYVFSPYLYFLVFILFSGIMAGVIAAAGLQFSYFLKNRIFAVSFMFIIMNLSSIYFESYGISLNLTDYIFGASAGGMTYKYMLITVAAYFILAILPIPFSIRRLKNCI